MRGWSGRKSSALVRVPWLFLGPWGGGFARRSFNKDYLGKEELKRGIEKISENSLIVDLPGDPRSMSMCVFMFVFGGSMFGFYLCELRPTGRVEETTVPSYQRGSTCSSQAAISEAVARKQPAATIVTKCELPHADACGALARQLPPECASGGLLASQYI